MATSAINRRVSVRDIAKEVGVSIQTISRHINNSGPVSVATAKAIQCSIEKLGYHPNAIGKSLVSGKTMSVGFALYHADYIGVVNETFFQRMLNGVMEVIATRGYSLQFLETCRRHDVPSHDTFYLDRVRSSAVDGLVIIDSVISDTDILHLERYGIPFVIVNRLVEKIKDRCVIEDNRKIGYTLARFLLDKGHRKIGYMGNARSFFETKCQLKGIYLAAEESGIHIDEKDIITFDRDINECEDYHKEYTIMKGIASSLSRPNFPDAIVCGAGTLSRRLADLILMGDVSSRFEIAGRIAETICNCKNFIYAASEQSKQMGVQAANLLLHYIEDKQEHRDPIIVDDAQYFRPKHRLDG